MKRKAVGKLCEPRHQKRILDFVLRSPLMIISARALETIFKKYIPKCFFS